MSFIKVVVFRDRINFFLKENVLSCQKKHYYPPSIIETNHNGG